MNPHQTNRRRITKRVIDGLGPGETAWDSEVRGFGVRRQKIKKVYVLKYRMHGRQRWLSIGEHGAPWTPDTARKEAQRLWGSIRSGVDPAREREANRDRPTVASLCKRYLEEYAEEHKKPSSVRTDRKNIENHVLPLLGKLIVVDVTRADIDHFKRSVRKGATASRANANRRHRGGAMVTGGTGVANRCLALLSKMFNLAERWGLRPDNSNPVRHIDKYHENPIERYLSAKELGSLGKAIAEAEKDGMNPFVLAALRLFIFTGARLSEILELRWDYVNFEKLILELPDSKTGKKRIYLNPPAAEVITNIPHVQGNPFVIVGHCKGRHLVNIQKPWQRIRKAAGLEDVRIHDLRHSFGSVTVGAGLTLTLLQKLLGHKSPITTQRYAHLADDPLRAANDLVGSRLSEGLQPVASLDLDTSAAEG